MTCVRVSEFTAQRAGFQVLVGSFTAPDVKIGGGGERGGEDVILQLGSLSKPRHLVVLHGLPDYLVPAAPTWRTSNTTQATGFYRISDDYDANEQWIGSFTKNAQVTMDAVRADSEQRRLGRGEVMLYGDVTQWLKSAEAGADPLVVPWAAHMMVRKEDGAWKLAQYRVWL
ncbi:hypothetical protein JDV02_000773 [Purpureocillium takamizusanense]|uniref:SnoaL-like domain-containing protein n=1 Tax=Purpureocillium takamizusanense TaxID=2060973 RepID=A0A9Q8V5V9_9HYPO|nr:uncharacterized protein JDV02_000773 [Purpureocillium takamizusanense]UNI14103.1 hypothetical protein JDV02_000773 [Purpureocillium takamizusanense]